VKLRDLCLGVIFCGAVLAGSLAKAPALRRGILTVPSALKKGASMERAEAQSSPLACKFVSVRSRIISSTSPEHAPTGSAGANPVGGGTFNAAGQLTGRSFVTYCVPPNNAAGAQPTGLTIKVRVDGALPGVPTDGGTDPSTILAIGQCSSFPVSAAIAPYTLGSADGGQLDTFECVPQ
jgi:hypothetical protein